MTNPSPSGTGAVATMPTTRRPPVPVPDRTAAASSLAELPREIRDVLDYDPRSMLARPTGFVSSLRSLSLRGTVGINSIMSGLSATGAGMLATIAAKLGTSPFALGDTAQTAIVAVAFSAAAAQTAVAWIRMAAREEYDGDLNRMRKRIVGMSSTCSDDDRLEALRGAKALAERQEGFDVVAMIKLDAVGRALSEAIDAAGPDARAAAEARDVAERAVSTIMATVGVRDSGGRSRQASAALAEVCSSLSQGTSMTHSAPSARIGRILSLADRALARHPDVVDSGGARLDDLVRIHVPRLVALRAEALQTARSQDVEAVDRAFETAFDGIAASIEEGIASIHDATMERLSTELRFLTNRRGGQSPLSSIA